MKQIEPLDTWIEEQMKARGFLRHGDMPGHWRSAGWTGHDLTIRHRTIRQWLKPYWPDMDAVKRKFAGTIDGLIAKGKANV